MIWDVATGSVIKSFVAINQYPVESVAYSPDGSKILTGCFDSNAGLWDVSSGTLIRVFSGHSRGISSVAFSPDGSKVVTGSFDRTATLWDISDIPGTGVIKQMDHTKNGQYSIILLPNNQLMFSTNSILHFKKGDLTISNGLGQTVAKYRFNELSFLANKGFMFPNSFAKGIYLYRLNNKERVVTTGSFIVSK